MSSKNVWAAVGVIAVIVAAFFVFRTLSQDGTADTLQPVTGTIPSDASPQNTTLTPRARKPVERPPLKDPSEGAMSPSLIRKAQSRLIELKYYDGEVDGQWSLPLTRAIKRYQQAEGLRADGALNVYTRHALGI